MTSCSTAQFRRCCARCLSGATLAMSLISADSPRHGEARRFNSGTPKFAPHSASITGQGNSPCRAAYCQACKQEGLTLGSQVADKPAHGRHGLQGEPGSASQALRRLIPMLLLSCSCSSQLALAIGTCCALAVGTFCKLVCLLEERLHNLKPRQHVTGAHGRDKHSAKHSNNTVHAQASPAFASHLWPHDLPRPSAVG